MKSFVITFGRCNLYKGTNISIAIDRKISHSLKHAWFTNYYCIKSFSIISKDNNNDNNFRFYSMK
jgi:hypothetical protein